MSEKTLRELAEAVVAKRQELADAGDPPTGDLVDAFEDAHADMLSVLHTDPTLTLGAGVILAALDAEREAGRREALEEVRDWLKRCWNVAHEECDEDYARIGAEYMACFADVFLRREEPADD